MVTVEKIIRDNTLVRRLMEDGVITPERLKKIYRALCKATHPDLRPRDHGSFIRLHDEYEEAVAYWDELKTRLTGNAGGDRLDPADVRRRFYDALRHYQAAGLYSQRMRLRPEARKRNELILREVLAWARLHRPSFIPVFLEYNKARLRPYLEWRKHDNLSKAGKLFIMGFNNICDFQTGLSPQSRRTARSCFSDCLDALATVEPSAASRSIERFARWWLDELAAPETGRGKGQL